MTIIVLCLTKNNNLMAFGYDGNGTGGDPAADVLKQNGGNNGGNGDGLVDPNDITDITGDPNDKPDPNDPPKEDPKDKPGDGEGDKGEQLQVGTVIEVGEDKYTVGENGDLLDKNGNVFKESKDVQEWLKEFEAADVDGELNIDNIIKLFDVKITDENDKEVEFENTPQGVKQYVEAVIESATEEIKNDTYEELYAKLPIFRDLIPYALANNGSIKGFDEEIKDYSNIQLDVNNEAQLISFIRTAWEEQHRRGDVESYINYLKSQGTLADVAGEELEALKALAEEKREQIRLKAEQAEREENERRVKYWNDIKATIDKREIAGFKLPETIIINKNGKKTSATVQDFYNYIYQVDNKGVSRYQYDVAEQDPIKQRDNELLSAYLMFTGGDYSNLVDIAINEKEVKKLKLVSKTRQQSTTVKITKPATNSKQYNFGYKQD